MAIPAFPPLLPMKCLLPFLVGKVIWKIFQHKLSPLSPTHRDPSRDRWPLFSQTDVLVPRWSQRGCRLRNRCRDLFQQPQYSTKLAIRCFFILQLWQYFSILFYHSWLMYDYYGDAKMHPSHQGASYLQQVNQKFNVVDCVILIKAYFLIFNNWICNSKS